MYHLREYPQIDYLGKILANNLIKFKVKEFIKDNISFFERYSVGDFETPDTLAFDFYGNSRHNWLLIVINEIIDPYHDWVMDQNTFRKFLVNKYLPDTTDPDAWHHFEDENGTDIPDPGTESLRAKYGISNLENILREVKFYRQDGKRIPEPNNEVDKLSTQVTLLDYEEELNQQRREILIVRTEYLSQIEAQLKELLEDVS